MTLHGLVHWNICGEFQNSPNSPGSQSVALSVVYNEKKKKIERIRSGVCYVVGAHPGWFVFIKVCWIVCHNQGLDQANSRGKVAGWQDSLWYGAPCYVATLKRQTILAVLSSDLGSGCCVLVLSLSGSEPVAASAHPTFFV